MCEVRFSVGTHGVFCSSEPPDFAVFCRKDTKFMRENVIYNSFLYSDFYHIEVKKETFFIQKYH